MTMTPDDHQVYSNEMIECHGEKELPSPVPRDKTYKRVWNSNQSRRRLM